MGVILKSKVIGSSDLQPSAFNFADIRAEAEQILQRARRELDDARARAEAIVIQAKDQIEETKRQAKAQAYKEGYEKGQAEGLQAGHEQALTEAKQDFATQSRELQESLQHVLSDVSDRRHELVARAHQELLALAIATGEKIVRKRIELDPSAVETNVRAAIDMVASRTAIKIRMNPADVETLKLLCPERAAAFDALRDISFIEDDAVELGGCLIETAGGQIDTQVSTQIDNIVQYLAPSMAEKIKSWQQSPGDEAQAKSSKKDSKTNAGKTRKKTGKTKR